MGKRSRMGESSCWQQERTKLIVSALVLLMLVFCCTSPGRAQVLYGSLTGTVTDTSGAAIAGAKVEAVNVATGASGSVTADSSGVYRFGNLQEGTYKVTVSAPTFGTSVSENVPVIVNNVQRVDAQLKIASQTQIVVVTSEAEVLQTEKADVHTDLSAQQVDNLPTAGSQGRNFQSLLRIIPGAGLTAETNSLSGNPQRAINTNVNGQSNQGVNTRIDGAQDAYPWLPANVAYVPPADAIQEVNVVTNSMDAEQGLAGGAAVNVQIKSGTNQFHGTGVWFYTDQALAARNYFQTNTTLFPKKNSNHQNQYGGTFGGPIVKNKLFFFVDYEGTLQHNLAGPDTRSLPTPAMLSGDFRNLPGNPIIYDPATGNATGQGKQQISCNGVLNVICPNRIDYASGQMAQLLQPSVAQEFPTANGLNNFSGSGVASFNRNNADIKINYLPNPRAMIFGRYSFSKTLVFDPPLLGNAGGDATNGGQLGEAPGLIQSVGLGGTYTFTPNLLLDWNFGFTRQNLSAQYQLGAPLGLDLLKIPGTNGAGVPNGNNLYNGLPAFQVNSASSNVNFGNPNTGNPFQFRDNQYVTGANLSWNKGKHNLRGGIEWNHTQLNHFQPQGGTFQTARGSFLFNGDVTSLPGTTPTYFNSVADFLLGLPSQTGKAYQVFNPIALRWNQWAWYVRDQWQVSPNLTLNLGLRWERYPFGYSDNGNGLRWFNPATGNVLIGGNGGVPENDGIDIGHGQFLPRVGVSYRLYPATVIRVGYGLSADPNNWRYFRNAYPSAVISNNAVPNSSSYIPIASLTGTNGTGLGNGAYSVPTGLVNIPAPDISSGVVPLPTTASTTTIPNPFNRGYINSFNLTFEQEYHGFVFQTGYVGAYDVRPLVNMNINPSAPGTGAAGGLLSTSLGKVYTGTINSLTPFKNSSYNSLQTKLTRLVKNGSSFGFVWTWSKALDYEDNEELNSLSFPYPAYWQKNYGPASFDRTQNFEIYGVFQLPFGRGQQCVTSGVGNQILGGWQVSTVISYMTGAPFTVTGASGPLNANGSIQTADLVGQYNQIGGQPLRTGQTCTATNLSCHFFNPVAFAAPVITSNANAHYGNTNRDEFRGPSYFNMNLSIARVFSLTERFKLQARADAISFTNTPHFANPNTSCCGANFGVITATASPGGFFGPDPGSRVVWLGLHLSF